MFSCGTPVCIRQDGPVCTRNSLLMRINRTLITIVGGSKPLLHMIHDLRRRQSLELSHLCFG